MSLLDGNALAGRLDDLLGWDATASLVRCRHCGVPGLLATAAVYASDMGVVVRCRSCEAVLVTLVDAPDGRTWLGMPGLSALEIRRA
ncbi:DUF6510 family protein [Microbacterium enclense]|uniref:Uncharacterized protein n=1 Tax=Microbacterium enclense TaxID=993073 RepID=A0A1G6QQ54_9MICO|nr:DUF6510 family protein [Microbacterium enclense]KSU51877.1 hypothetical protein AS029_15210 [Microbacterium enclense]SDC94403.1 hypothetical protein SAMN05216418_3331 [Microbacterium enclense]